jgi:hypothetical protein
MIPEKPSPSLENHGCLPRQSAESPENPDTKPETASASEWSSAQSPPDALGPLPASGRRNRSLIIKKMVALTVSPSASVMMATAVNPGLLRNYAARSECLEAVLSSCYLLTTRTAAPTPDRPGLRGAREGKPTRRQRAPARRPMQEDQRVMRLDFKQLAFDKARQCQGRNQPGRDSCHCRSHPSCQNQPHNVPALRTQGCANAEFAYPQANGVRHHAINADARQADGDRAKMPKQQQRRSSGCERSVNVLLKCANVGDGLIGIGFEYGLSQRLNERRRRQPAPHHNADVGGRGEEVSLSAIHSRSRIVIDSPLMNGRNDAHDFTTCPRNSHAGPSGFSFG